MKKTASSFLLIVTLLLGVPCFAKGQLGIIGGGGAGLAAAWLMESAYDVTLFEKADHLGGHADTVLVNLDGKTIPVDAGAEFFTDAESPHFKRLLQLLGVPVHRLPLTYTFHRSDGSDVLVMTPFHDGKIKWRSFSPEHLWDLLQLKYTTSEGQKFAATGNIKAKVEDFVNELSVSKSFKRDILYPFYAAGWGVSQEDIKQFSAFDVLSTTTQNTHLFSIFPPQFNEVQEGMSAYIEAEARQLTNTHIKLGSNISQITYDGQNYTVMESDGKASQFERLVFATHGNQTAAFLKNIPEASDIRSVLRKLKYYTTRIAIHGDESFLPPHHSDRSIVNVRYDGTHSAMTIFNAWRGSNHLFKSWIVNPDEAVPKPLYAWIEYEHATIDSDYEQAQVDLAKYQGKNHLWIAGSYTDGVNCHESAIMSAVRIAQDWAPESERLKLLMD